MSHRTLEYLNEIRLNDKIQIVRELLSTCTIYSLLVSDDDAERILWVKNDRVLFANCYWGMIVYDWRQISNELPFNKEELASLIPNIFATSLASMDTQLVPWSATFTNSERQYELKIIRDAKNC